MNGLHYPCLYSVAGNSSESVSVVVNMFGAMIS